MSERQVDHPILDLFHMRWSPRAMTGEPVDRNDLMALFEAARWAPSAFNNQPWRFFFAMRDTDHWPKFFGLLGDSNKVWCAQAGALVLLASKTTFDHNGEKARLYAFDAGAAWENFALEATHRGLVTHPMQGFDHIAAKSALNLPEELDPMIMIAVGHQGPAGSLPESLQAREKPSPRRPSKELVHEGPLPG